MFTQSFIRVQIKETSKLRVTGLCAGYSPGTGEFPAQMASNAENVSIWWRHHGHLGPVTNCGRYCNPRRPLVRLHTRAQYLRCFVFFFILLTIISLDYIWFADMCEFRHIVFKRNAAYSLGVIRGMAWLINCRWDKLLNRYGYNNPRLTPQLLEIYIKSSWNFTGRCAKRCLLNIR